MFKLSLIVVVTFLQLHCNCSALTIDKEAEYGTTLGTRMFRSAASNDRTVWLHRGETIVLSLTTEGPCSMRITNAVYSNDGNSDRVSIRVNGVFLGQFRTRSKSNWGYLWNVFLSTGSIGNTIALSIGTHTIKIVADYTDYYGVEIDKITLEMHCTIVTPTPTPHPTPTSTPNPTPTSTPNPLLNPTMIPFSLEAENGIFTGTHRFRSAASNDSTVWLHSGETIKLNLALTGKSCLLHIKNMVYSNDGNSDRVSVLVDGTFLGQFQTRSKSDWGTLWNVFLRTGPIGKMTSVSNGTHVIKIVATYTDYYGVEIDQITLESNCKYMAPTSISVLPCCSIYDIIQNSSRIKLTSLEAEDGTSSGIQRYRSNASNYITVWLHDKETIVFRLNITTTEMFCLIQIKNIVYSNDGNIDHVCVLFDRISFGCFKTRSKSNYGHLWNTFISTGTIGNINTLSTGIYVMKIIANYTDFYGVEIDTITLESNCTNIVEFNSRSPPNLYLSYSSTTDFNSRSPPTSSSSKELLSTCLMLFLTVLYCSCTLF